MGKKLGNLNSVNLFLFTTSPVKHLYLAPTSFLKNSWTFISARLYLSILCKGCEGWPALISCKIHPLLFQLFFLTWDFLVLVLPLSSFSLPPFFQPLTLQAMPFWNLSVLYFLLICFNIILLFSHTDLCLDALGCALSIICSSPLSFFIFHLQSPVLAMLKRFFSSSLQWLSGNTFSQWGWLAVVIPGCPERLWYLHPWGVILHYWLWWPCLSRGMAQVTSRAPSPLSHSGMLK